MTTRTTLTKSLHTVSAVSRVALHLMQTQAFMNDVRLRAATIAVVFRPHPTLRLRASG